MNTFWKLSTLSVGASLLVVGDSAAQAPSDPVLVPIAAETVPAAAPTVSGEACSACSPTTAADDVFKKVPPVRPFPRAGNFPNPPVGAGSYSLLEALSGTETKGPPKYPYPRFGLMMPSFYDADFRYLDDPKNTETDYADGLKRIRLGDDFLFSTGGSLWNRTHGEYNSRLTQRDNNYNLTRVRTYADLWYKDEARIYAEFLGGFSADQDLPPLAIDQTGPDFLNLFLDLKLMDYLGKPVYARVGRQELSYGSQRLISNLEWANTRRTFQGAKVFRSGEQWDFDLFWVQPVIQNVNKLDWADTSVNFAGAWATYRPKKGTTLDLYGLVLDNRNAIRQQGIVRGPSTLATFGSRFAGDVDDKFLYDFEGAMQLGSLDNAAGRANVVAGMATVGLGYHEKSLKWNPTFWLYYDYASGDDRPNAGTSHTFNQLFPFGHYYMGWTDLIGRQNINDINAHLYLYPAKWLTLHGQYHRFFLASSRDALYNPAGVAVRRDASGNSGTDVGQEISLTGNIHLTKHADILVGYSHLFGGDFLRRTSGPNAAANASVFFVQTSYRW